MKKERKEKRTKLPDAENQLQEADTDVQCGKTEDFEDDQTFVKYVINQNKCVMCDESCNDLMIQCQYCHGMVHFICSLLPGYFLSIIEQGSVQFKCYNCSNDRVNLKNLILLIKCVKKMKS